MISSKKTLRPCRPRCSIALALRRWQTLWPLFAMFLFSAPTMAQQAPQAEPQIHPQSSLSTSGLAQNSAPDQTPIIIQGGTRLALVLTHPVDSKFTGRGDRIYAETTAPLILESRVVVPAGSFVQGKVEKLTRRGSRAELLMQSVSIVLPDGYVASIAGPLTIESVEWTAWRNPTSGEKTAMFLAPAMGLGLGMLIGSAAHTTHTTTLGGMTLTSKTPTGIGVGSMAGLGAGSVVSLLLYARSRHFYVEAGSALEMVLPQRLTVAPGQSTGPAASRRVNPPESAAWASARRPPSLEAEGIFGGDVAHGGQVRTTLNSSWLAKRNLMITTFQLKESCCHCLINGQHVGVMCVVGYQHRIYGMPD